MKFEIKNQWDGSLIFSVEAENWRVAVEAAIGAKANLRSANLSSADLRSANLRSADLRLANLSSADLRLADLRSANLRSANLSSADLRLADLRSANLRSANLSSADLRSANLRSANLSSADLRSANLSSANLRSAKGLERFPISIMGHKHPLWTTQSGKLCIGCHVHTFSEWERHVEKIGEAEDYSAIDVEIYKLHIAHLKKVSELLWNKKEK